MQTCTPIQSIFSSTSSAGNGLTSAKEDEVGNVKDSRFENEDLFTIGWWNGGGGVRKRLIVNPGLKEFISTKPDIWTYSESGITNSQNLSLDG